MRTERAVILAGGLGKRMRRPSHTMLSGEAERLARRGLKALIPVGGRPFLDYLVGRMLAAGLHRLCLVVAPDGELLMDYARRTGELSGAELTWAVQAEPLGTADAVLAAEEFVGSEPFILANCDNLYPQDALRRLARTSDNSCCVVAFDREGLVRKGNFAAERVKTFATLLVTPDGQLEDIVEKPAEPERYVQDGRLWVLGATVDRRWADASREGVPRTAPRVRARHLVHSDWRYVSPGRLSQPLSLSLSQDSYGL